MHFEPDDRKDLDFTGRFGGRHLRILAGCGSERSALRPVRFPWSVHTPLQCPHDLDGGRSRRCDGDASERDARGSRRRVLGPGPRARWRTPTAWLSRRFSRAIGLDGRADPLGAPGARQRRGDRAHAGGRRAQRRTLRCSRDDSFRRGFRRPDGGLRSDPPGELRSACRDRGDRRRPRRLARLRDQRGPPGRPRARGPRSPAIVSARLDRSCHRVLLLRRRWPSTSPQARRRTGTTPTSGA